MSTTASAIFGLRPPNLIRWSNQAVQWMTAGNDEHMETQVHVSSVQPLQAVQTGAALRKSLTSCFGHFLLALHSSGLISQSKDEHAGLIGDLPSAVGQPGVDGPETRPRRNSSFQPAVLWDRLPPATLIGVNGR